MAKTVGKTQKEIKLLGAAIKLPIIQEEKHQHPGLNGYWIDVIVVGRVSTATGNKSIELRLKGAYKNKASAALKGTAFFTYYTGGHGKYDKQVEHLREYKWEGKKLKLNTSTSSKLPQRYSGIVEVLFSLGYERFKKAIKERK